MNGTTYMIYTTIDITRTGVTRSDPKNEHSFLQRNQQRNFDTLCQVISMRSIFEVILADSQIYGSKSALLEILSIKENIDIRVWRLRFITDRPNVFGDHGDILAQDLHMTPIIPGLESTIPAFPSCFLTRGSQKNTIVRWF